MTFSTINAATQITPVVIKTFLQHYHGKLDKEKRANHNDPSNDIIFDQAFHIVRKFLDICTYSDVESVQAFTNTHIPSPPWSTVIRSLIPLSKCNEAADLLIKWFGSPEEIRRVVGGDRWWQVRGIDGVEAEWITMRSFVNNSSPKNRGEKRAQGVLHDNMNKLDRVMLFIHGGAFYWGSINTHRYQILRLARKIGGRCFAVNYRKAPQYPFPCAVQDVLAAYLYLIRPPPDSWHTPVDPKNIVIAGDSAGGNLALVLLTLIRDLELPMPAGSVLISPWVDLTHSFPSVMANTATDIIPKYGFIHRPSVLWPIPAIPESVVGRVARPGQIIPRVAESLGHRQTHDVSAVTGEDISQLRLWGNEKRNSRADGQSNGAEDNTHDVLSQIPVEKRRRMGQPVTVQMSDCDTGSLELRAQIQLYATNDQLTHPLVSPLLQGSLGGLCPLYILAGDSEVLRDEIVYLAHRASDPKRYTVRDELTDDDEQQKRNEENLTTPTKVHLQVYDGMPHVMTVYSFYHPVKYAYRAIAAFARHVIDNPPSITQNEPFPIPPEPREPNDSDSEDTDDEDSTLVERIVRSAPTSPRAAAKTIQKKAGEVKNNLHEAVKQLSGESTKGLSATDVRRQGSAFADPELAGQTLITERVDLDGRLRKLEPSNSLPAMQLPREEIGIIKEAPAKRYLEGQDKWDKAFRKRAERVVKHRAKYRVKAQQMLTKAKTMGLLDENMKPLANPGPTPDDVRVNRRRWGPLDLDDDHAPPSAIAGRRDSPESLALIKASLYASRVGTVRPANAKLGKLKATDKMRVRVTKDEPMGPIQASPSEQQQYRGVLPVHGLDIWAGIMRIFTRESRRKARKHRKQSLQPGEISPVLSPRAPSPTLA